MKDAQRLFDGGHEDDATALARKVLERVADYEAAKQLLQSVQSRLDNRRARRDDFDRALYARRYFHALRILREVEALDEADDELRRKKARIWQGIEEANDFVRFHLWLLLGTAVLLITQAIVGSFEPALTEVFSSRELSGISTSPSELPVTAKLSLEAILWLPTMIALTMTLRGRGSIAKGVRWSMLGLGGLFGCHLVQHFSLALSADSYKFSQPVMQLTLKLLQALEGGIIGILWAALFISESSFVVGKLGPSMRIQMGLIALSGILAAGYAAWSGLVLLILIPWLSAMLVAEFHHWQAFDKRLHLFDRMRLGRAGFSLWRPSDEEGRHSSLYFQGRDGRASPSDPDLSSSSTRYKFPWRIATLIGMAYIAILGVFLAASFYSKSTTNRNPVDSKPQRDPSPSRPYSPLPKPPRRNSLPVPNGVNIPGFMSTGFYTSQ